MRGTEQDGAAVADNPAASRYELHLDDRLVGVIDYDAQNGTRVFVHTEIDSEYEDRGLGTRLVAAALEDARGRRLSVVPVCPFVKAFLRSHPDFADVAPTST